MNKKQLTNSSIAQNKKALHDYFVEERFEAGIALMGWEVKSLRASRVNLTDSYVLLKQHELFLIGTNITPLNTVSTHIQPDATRTRKLLLKKTEIKKLIGSIERKGYTLIPLRLYWKNNHIKLEIGLAKGKKQYDKRATLKEKESKREAERAIKKRLS